MSRSLATAWMRRSRSWQEATSARLGQGRHPPTRRARASSAATSQMPVRPPSWTDAGFMLDNWEVRPRHGTLARLDHVPSEAVRVEPRVMAVLTCLARHVGEVVTRDEFSTEVWGGRVVSDEALSRCISLLRQVLEDDSRDPRFIRTIARVGYILVPTPAPLRSGAVDAPLLPQTGIAPPVPTQPAATVAAP